jgi:hypothetical protein
VRGAGVLASTWWFWKVRVDLGVWDAGMARVRTLDDDTSYDAACIGKPQPYLLAIFYTTCIPLKACIRMVK